MKMTHREFLVWLGGLGSLGLLGGLVKHKMLPAPAFPSGSALEAVKCPPFVTMSPLKLFPAP